MALGECDIRLCYMCPDAWLPDQQWSSTHSGAAGDLTGATLGPQGIAETETSGGAKGDGLKRESNSVSSNTSDDGDSKATGRGPITTLMIRNVPSNYSQDMLCRELESLDLHTACNFIYLPYLPLDPVIPWNIGCAFINFWTPEDAERARAALSGHVWQDGLDAGMKFLDVADAVIQGYENNVKHYNLTAVNEVGWEWVGTPTQTTCVPSYSSSPPSLATEHCDGQGGEEGSDLAFLPSEALPQSAAEAVLRTPSHSPEPQASAPTSPQWGAQSVPASLLQLAPQPHQQRGSHSPPREARCLPKVAPAAEAPRQITIVEIPPPLALTAEAAPLELCVGFGQRPNRWPSRQALRSHQARRSARLPPKRRKSRWAWTIGHR